MKETTCEGLGPVGGLGNMVVAGGPRGGSWGDGRENDGRGSEREGNISYGRKSSVAALVVLFQLGRRPQWM